MSHVLRLVLLALLLLAVPANTQAEEGQPQAVIVEAAAYYGLDPTRLLSVAWCESKLNPYAVGAAGELGLFQLHPRGLLRLFYAVGYDDPWDSSQQAYFAAWAFAHGYARHWSCARWNP